MEQQRSLLTKRFVKALWYRIPAQRSPASLNVQLQWQKAMSLDVHRYYWKSSCGGVIIRITKSELKNNGRSRMSDPWRPPFRIIGIMETLFDEIWI